MSTRSNIGVRNLDGTVDYIYCHFDGYPEGVGKTLISSYQDMDRVNELMKLGDLSSLGEEIGEKSVFDNYLTRARNWCLAYGRDRGDSDVSVSTTTFEDLLANDNVDYLYVFDGDYWECYDMNTKESINLYNQK